MIRVRRHGFIGSAAIFEPENNRDSRPPDGLLVVSSASFDGNGGYFSLSNLGDAMVTAKPTASCSEGPPLPVPR